MKRLSCLGFCIGRVVAVLSAAVLATPSNAATINVAADTWVREDSPASNRNADPFMNARTDADGAQNDVTFLRFDTSSVSSASGASLDLTWYRTDSTSNRTLTLWGIIDASAADTAWDETSITYNTAPGMLPDGVTSTAEVTAMNADVDVKDLNGSLVTALLSNLPYGPQMEGQVYSFSGAALDAFVNADTNGIVTFLITRDTNVSGNQARFTTKEATTFVSGAAVPSGGAGARLTGVELVPEPSAAALVALMAAATTCRRRLA